MTSRRLTDADKQQIVLLYRQPGETAINLANQFGVSNSTIGRILKTLMGIEDYELLVQQKRSQRSGGDSSEVEPAVPASQLVMALEPKAVEPELAPSTEEISRKPRRRSLPDVSPKPAAVELIGLEPSSEPFLDPIELAPLELEKPSSSKPVRANKAAGPALAVEFDDDIEDGLDSLDDDLSGDFDDDDEDGEGASLAGLQIDASSFVAIRPMAEADMPKVCYLVVDRSAELITPPLRDFGELGTIATAETEAKTLPIFDNHRVARRFSNVRTQRVIKVPDTRVFYKVATHLQAKGITRMLVDGQIFSI
jgi:transposase-like protein